MAMPPLRLHMREMHPIEDGEFSHTIQLKRLKSGKLVWIWEVRKTFTGSILDRGVSVRSRDAAITAALAAVISAAQAAERTHGPAPW
jgi:hypothetical protein